MSEIRRLIEETLDTIVDPCSAAIGKPVGLKSMGLVKRIDVEREGDGLRVKLELRVTSPCCMMGPSFTQQAKLKLGSLQGIVQVDVSISPEIDWTPGYMDPSYRATLRGPRIGFPSNTGDG